MWLPFKKAAPDRKASAAPRQPDIMYLNSGVGVAIVKYDEAISAHAAMKHPIVYRAINKLATSVGQMHWNVVDDPKATKGEVSGTAKAKRQLQALIDYPNDDMTPEMLRYWMAMNYAIYGRVPLKFGMSAMDNTIANGIYPLEARKIRAYKNSRGMVRSYDYGDGSEKETYASLAVWKEQDSKANGFADQIWKPGLKGYMHHEESNNPLSAIGLPAQVVTSLLMRAIQTAEGHPNVRYLVTASKTLTFQQKEMLAKHLNEDHSIDGPDAGKVPILTNAADVVIHKLDNDLSDIHSKMPADDMARLIFGAFDIPIALAGIGAADAAKFAGNYDGSRSAFWEDTVIPSYVSPLFKGLTRMICPPGLIIQPDYDSIPALHAKRVGGMQTVKDVKFLTTEEKRTLFGYGAATSPTEGELERLTNATPEANDE